MNQQGIQSVVNGDTVIMFTDRKQVASIQGGHDLPSLYSWYQEDPTKNHLGLMNLWGKQATYSYNGGLLKELLSNKGVIEVNGWDGKFTYDLPVVDYKGCYTVRDGSTQAFPGIEGNTFKLVLNRAYTTGDILSNNKYYGQQVIVSGEEPVVPTLEGYEHTVTLVSNDKSEWFLQSNLLKGIQYYKVGHAILGERGTNFSHIEMPDTTGVMKCEFQLGAASGVEQYITGMADSKSFSGASSQSKDYLDLLQKEFNGNEYAILAPLKTNAAGKRVPDLKSAKLGATMELLTMRELERLTSSQLMFQKGGTIRSSNGVTRLNEGLWHQLRRGKIVTYGRPGGITKAHIQEVAEYIFRINPMKQDVQRSLKFKCGKYAYQNVLSIFSDEVNAQNASLNAFLGADRVLPMSPVSGSNLLELEYKPVRFTKVFLPGVGTVEIEEDVNMNYMEGSDRFAKGMHPEGFAPTAYSMIVWDVDDQYYSNNKEMPKGATLMEGGNAGANINLIRPQGEMVYWGSTSGRYSYRKAGDIMSSMKQIGEEYWAFNICSVWVKDITRFVTIELDPAARKGFN